MKSTFGIAWLCLTTAISLGGNGCVCHSPSSSSSLQERFAKTLDPGGTNRTFLATRLKPIQDDVTVTGTVEQVSGEFDTPADYAHYTSNNCAPGDCDIEFLLHLEPESASNIARILKTNLNIERIGCESPPFARKKNFFGGTPTDAVFPGWRDTSSESSNMILDHNRFWPNKKDGWSQLRWKRVIVRGVLALDCDVGKVDGCEPIVVNPNNPTPRFNVEIHPIYEVEYP